MSSPIRRRSIFSISVTTAVQIEHLGLEHLLAAEREQLPDQRPRPRPSAVDLDHRLSHRIAGREVAHEQVAVAADHREQVVEVVRYTAREGAESLPSSGLAGIAPRADGARSRPDSAPIRPVTRPWSSP